MRHRRVPNSQRELLGLAFAVLAWIALLPLAARAERGRTITYSFQDDLLLTRGQRRGGAVYVSEALSKQGSAPLVVFLHGLDPRSELHWWMNGKRGRDLRRDVDRWFRYRDMQPFLIAAPSQTRLARASATLWPEFDLGAFVDATERALAGMPGIDRSKVVVVGHSGAGCNPDGGLSSIATRESSIVPLAILAIDICMNDDTALALASAPPTTSVYVYWQDASWARPFDAFERTFLANRSPAASTDVLEEIVVRRANPHHAIVPMAIDRALRRILPPP